MAKVMRLTAQDKDNLQRFVKEGSDSKILEYVEKLMFHNYENGVNEGYARASKVAQAKDKASGNEQVKEPKRYEIPKGAQATSCRSCGDLVYWGLTENQKRVPLNIDGTSHFTTCPQAKNWSKSK